MSQDACPDKSFSRRRTKSASKGCDQKTGNGSSDRQTEKQNMIKHQRKDNITKGHV